MSGAEAEAFASIGARAQRCTSSRARCGAAEPRFALAECHADGDAMRLAVRRGLNGADGPHGGGRLAGAADARDTSAACDGEADDGGPRAAARCHGGGDPGSDAGAPCPERPRSRPGCSPRVARAPPSRPLWPAPPPRGAPAPAAPARPGASHRPLADAWPRSPVGAPLRAAWQPPGAAAPHAGPAPAGGVSAADAALPADAGPPAGAAPRSAFAARPAGRPPPPFPGPPSPLPPCRAAAGRQASRRSAGRALVPASPSRGRPPAEAAAESAA